MIKIKGKEEKIVLGVSGVYSLGDAQVLEAMLSGTKGVRQFRFDTAVNELDVVFDPEVISSRSLVDGIQLGSNGKFKLHVRNPYARMASKDGSESSTMFRLFISSLFLSVSISFDCHLVSLYLVVYCFGLKTNVVSF